MINGIEIRNFQSLHHVSLTLAPLTVIVGPSSSGKSAFTRALRLLTSNARGTTFISTGARTAQVIASTDRGTISISRGAENAYTLIPTDSPQQSFTKLAAAVPEEVTAFLGIAPGDPLNFSSQFDKPYLLSDSPAEVARTLGALTNVNVVFEASREANRRRLATSATLRTRASDIDSLTASLEDLPAIKAQAQSLEEATALLIKAEAINEEFLGLSSTASTLQEAAVKLKSIKHPIIPDISKLLSTHASITALQASIASLQQAASRYAGAKAAITRARELEEAAEQEFATALNSLAQDIQKRLNPLAIDFRVTVTEAADTAAEYFTELLS